MRNNQGKTAQIFTEEHLMIEAMSKSRVVHIEDFVFSQVVQKYKEIRKEFLTDVRKTNIIGKEFNIRGLDNKFKIVTNTFEKNLRDDYFFPERLTVLNNLREFIEKADIFDEKLINLSDYKDEKKEEKKKKSLNMFIARANI